MALAKFTLQAAVVCLIVFFGYNHKEDNHQPVALVAIAAIAAEVEAVRLSKDLRHALQGAI